MADTPLAHLFDSLDRTEGVDHPLYISLRYYASVLCAYVGVYVHAWVAPCRPEALRSPLLLLYVARAMRRSPPPKRLGTHPYRSS